MDFIIFSTLLLFLTTRCFSQQYSISGSINEFSINVLRQTLSHEESLNVALSPYTIWSLLTVISEGSLDNTFLQLETALKLPKDKSLLRSHYKNLSNILQSKFDGVNLDLNTALFANKDFPVKKSYQNITEQFYKVKSNPINFKNPVEAAGVINKYVSQATKSRIQVFVNTDDVIYAQLFLTSIMFFKGQWWKPFNKTATHKETFYDEKNNKNGEVDMMFQVGIFPYSRMENINAHTIELPYGSGRKMSLILVLPFKGETVANVLNLLSKMPFSNIIKSLEDAEQQFVDDEVHVYLPKFKISSDFNLNIILSEIGIKDLFDVEKANLLGMFDHYLYLSRFIQKAEIEVNEEGTIASSATGASFSNKSRPPKFRANKPFLYFIVDKTTKTIIFSGKVSNPKTFIK